MTNPLRIDEGYVISRDVGPIREFVDTDKWQLPKAKYLIDGREVSRLAWNVSRRWARFASKVRRWI